MVCKRNFAELEQVWNQNGQEEALKEITRNSGALVGTPFT
jgi:hypothetical protein